jgi:hypothetical protein
MLKNWSAWAPSPPQVPAFEYLVLAYCFASDWFLFWKLVFPTVGLFNNIKKPLKCSGSIYGVIDIVNIYIEV